MRRKSLLLCVTMACEVIERNVKCAEKERNGETRGRTFTYRQTDDGNKVLRSDNSNVCVTLRRRLSNGASPTPGGRSHGGASHCGLMDLKALALGDREGLSPFLGSREHLRWFTLVFVPGRRCYRTLGGPLHYNELIGVVVRPVMQQEFLNCPLFNLQGQRGGN